jgi:hypothetical protein
MRKPKVFYPDPELVKGLNDILESERKKKTKRETVGRKSIK